VSGRDSKSSRRNFLRAGCLGATFPVLSGALPAGAPQPFKRSVERFEFEEATISELGERMRSGQLTSRALVEAYLQRIDAIDKGGPRLNSIIEINPDAVSIAESLDRERKAKGPRGPLHGLPILIKDNISTADKMATTAGSLALVGAKPPSDAFLAKKLREAGAVILGKTNLSEWANIRSQHSTSGWSGRGGLTRNPYALDRNPCGSSSGSGAAASASLCAAAIGTETDGSVVCPSSANGVVGIKPTLGLVSRFGIVPIAHSQDTAGPMARTVSDAATLLGALTGVDSEDSATAPSVGKSFTDYTRFLDVNGLKGKRLGVVRKLFGFNEAVDRLITEALDEMKRMGAVLIDPVEIDSIGKFDGAELNVLLYELKADLNKYLAWLGPSSPVRSLKDVIDFNTLHAAEEMPYFGQDLFLKAEAKGPLTDKAYVDALAKDQQLARQQGIDAAMDKHQLDALVGPTAGLPWMTDLVNGDHDTGGSSTLPAVAGYPHITVPAGLVRGLPAGISFFGRAWSEPVLLKIAYSFEQATKARRIPGFAESSAAGVMT
jgi:amidase